MDATIVRGLNDKLYDRRKGAALELEKVVSAADNAKITRIINQLCLMFTSPSSALHARNGGLIGLAATAIALGQKFAQWLSVVIPRVLGCFSDPESRVRYYACESLYNIAKVCKGEILVHFNGIFDALSKLSADSEASVKNGAELLDRLLKDIVAETALNYVSQYPENVDLTFNTYGSEHWHERQQEGDVLDGKFPQSSYHYRQHALLHGAGSVAGKTIGMPIREGNQVRSHPLEDSPVMAAQDLPLPIPVSLSAQQAGASLPQPRSQGSVASTTSYLARPQSGVFQHTSNSANLADEPKSGNGVLPGERTDSPAATRDPSPHGLGATHSANAKVGPVSTPGTSSGATGSGHHRILSTQSAVPSTQVNHLSVNASSASQHSTSPTPSQGHLSSGFAVAEAGRIEITGASQGESAVPVAQQPQRISNPAPRLAFSLAKFIPLLSERIYVISPFTRSHLVSWIMILDSVPDLELVSYLPEFLDGLLKYLSDPNPDVKIAAETVLSDFLREIKHIARVQQRHSETHSANRTQGPMESGHPTARRVSDFHASSTYPGVRRRASKNTLNTEGSELESGHTGLGANSDAAGDSSHTMKSIMSPDLADLDELHEDEEAGNDGVESALEHGHDAYGEDQEPEEHAAWIPGQDVYVDHACIIDIMIHHLTYPGKSPLYVSETPQQPWLMPQIELTTDEQIQLIALRWIATFLTVVQHVMVPFAPRLIPAILPNLAHHVPYIQSAAVETNQLLYSVIQNLPDPKANPVETAPLAGTSSSISQNPTTPHTGASSVPGNGPNAAAVAAGPLPLTTASSARKDTNPNDTASEGLASRRKSSDAITEGLRSTTSLTTLPSSGNIIKPKSLAVSPGPSEPQTPIAFEYPNKSRPGSPSGIPIPVANPAAGSLAQQQATSDTQLQASEQDPFDIRETVNVLTLQFVSEHEETRIAALEWLSMLHRKAPSELFARDDGTFPALLKTLSDPSEEVIKHDLQLLAQISANSEDSWFASFLVKLLELFSTDRRLLENRGSLIIRQLCVNLNSERIFRTMAEVLEKDEDLEFASMMVVKLNMILITSPELSDFRKRLKSIESKDGQALFISIYKSWCHNAVAAFSLCLLAQAYEHASNLLQIFAELEMTVALLVQIDKLVMLIESPIFTSLRLQLLEPEKYPYLFKCLYGLLMMLPQSSAFVSLRNRLNAVSSMGYLHTMPKATYTSSVATTRSKIASRDEIKWEDLLRHFRAVQNKHEKARRLAQMGDSGQLQSVGGFHFASGSTTSSPFGGTGSQPTGSSLTKRKVPGAAIRKESGNNSTNSGSKTQSGSVLSPLNPKRGAGSTSTSATGGNGSLSALTLGAPFSSSMQVNAAAGATGPSIVNRPRSPPAKSRVRGILPGLRKA
ncbi:hypothetical protein NliqN6_5090 [Naganishia liquefaciens]|uniref:Vacuolar protein 14 C-terminal Fig4-binding domain-containing protein n=1 Tax=Naganishia liquefaciens TaxID=104408 RepID=A0A8H3YGV1_9TREE|nr:hypothetical protein NliqN6_5090 [Naganishia liquefaciens]